MTKEHNCRKNYIFLPVPPHLVWLWFLYLNLYQFENSSWRLMFLVFGMCWGKSLFYQFERSSRRLMSAKWALKNFHGTDIDSVDFRHCHSYNIIRIQMFFYDKVCAICCLIHVYEMSRFDMTCAKLFFVTKMENCTGNVRMEMWQLKRWEGNLMMEFA